MTMPTLTMQRAHDEAMGGDDPTLPPKPRRRTFTAEYKLSIVEQYDACVGDGDKGALLRREGLYSSHIVEWRRARDAAALDGLSPRTRQSATTPDAVALAKANRRIERLEADLAKHKLALEIAGRAHAYVGDRCQEAASSSRARRPSKTFCRPT
jgi:transposase-like protein